MYSLPDTACQPFITAAHRAAVSVLVTGWYVVWNCCFSIEKISFSLYATFSSWISQFYSVSVDEWMISISIKNVFGITWFDHAWQTLVIMGINVQKCKDENNVHHLPKSTSGFGGVAGSPWLGLVCRCRMFSDQVFLSFMRSQASVKDSFSTLTWQVTQHTPHF